MPVANAGVHAEKKPMPAAKAELVQLVSHRLRDPLSPLLIALEVLRHEDLLSGLGIEMIRVLRSGIKEEARVAEELLNLIEMVCKESTELPTAD